MKISLNDGQRNTIFPANICIDSGFRILSAGPVAPRLVPNLQLGGYLFDYIASGHSDDEYYLSSAIGSDKLVRFEPKGVGSPLVGWVVPSEFGYILVLRISPDNFLLDGSSLQISDFAPGDPFVHGLLMFTMQRAMLEEQKSLTKELAESQQKTENLLNRFSRVAGFMAHDFNNFLSIIRLNCDRLANELATDDRLLRLIDIIRSTAARGSGITRSLMTLSKQREDSSFPIHVDQLVGENIAFLSSVVGTHVRVAPDLRAPGARTFASPTGLLNCIVNLLINARDAMPNGGTISLKTFLKTLSADDTRVAEKRHFIVLQIVDNGSGMSEEVLAHAFEPLFSTKTTGNGLGLASVKDFTLALGGDARIQSKQSLGTTVELLLPVWSTAEDILTNRTTDLGQTETGPIISAPVKILVVDDEPYALEALLELLDAAGFEVAGCTSSKAAEAELATGKFNVLLTDIVLKNESGTDLAKLAVSRDPKLSVLLMSGYVPVDEQLDPKWAFVRKPINTQTLIETLKSL